jgi:phytoene dehydrogenase-like protein
VSEEQIPSTTDAVVIGAGLAGLVAAAALTRGGHAVVVLEKSTTLGGRAATHETDGYYWNVGPHALYVRGETRRILKKLGIDPRGGLPSASGGFAIRDSRKHTLPSGFVSLLSTGLLALPAKIELGKLLAAVPKLDTTKLDGMTVDEWKRSAIKHERVGELISALIRLTTYTDADNRMCARAAVEQLQLALTGNVEYLDGGWQVMVDALAGCIRSAGGAIVVGVRAQAVETRGAVTAVRLADGRRIRTRAVVLASPPKSAAALVDGPDGEALRATVERVEPVRAACLDLALDSLPDPRARFALGIDRALYFSVHSAVARVAPSGGATIHVMRYVAPDTAGAAEETRATDDVERELERLADLIQPGWRDVVHARRFLPALTVQGDFPRARIGGKGGRASIDAAGVEGLYLAGDWVGPVGLLADCASASGERAAAVCSAYLERVRKQAA